MRDSANSSTDHAACDSGLGRAWRALSYAFFRARVEQADAWILWSVSPDTGLVAAFPDFEESSYRWDRPGDAPFI